MLQKIIKKRNSGIDLIRLVAMLGIVYTHILAQGKGTAKYFRYKNEIVRTLTFVFWHNNAFTLIAGIVGYKSTKYSNLLYLWICIVFYSLGIHYYFQRFKPNVNVNGELYKEYFPVIYNRYWFFTSYFGMFIFLPAINKGLQYLNKSEFKLLVLSIFFILSFGLTILIIKLMFFI
jgi:surface polysaccharide O-acyltransferase-like enzyme